MYDVLTPRGFNPPSWVLKRIVDVMIAIYLLVGFFSKVSAVSVVSNSSLFSSPGFKLGIAQFELLLAVALILGLYSNVVRLLASFVFILFAIVGLWMGVLGFSSCGCFGSIEVSPWIIATVDLVVAAVAFFIYRTTVAELRQCVNWKQAGLLLLVFVGGLLGWGFRFALDGQAGLVSPEVVDLGVCKAGEIVSREVQVLNTTSSPFKLIGSNAKCACRVGVEFPLELAPNKSLRIPLEFQVKNELGGYRHQIKFFTDASGVSTLTVVLSGYVSR